HASILGTVTVAQQLNRRWLHFQNQTLAPLVNSHFSILGTVTVAQQLKEAIAFILGTPFMVDFITCYNLLS
ncbi:MAG: hypothetical protein QNJ64_11440, partial [Crocosphaera sp.]|nr:hypothetical protein [Crocosphaera sp.]